MEQGMNIDPDVLITTLQNKLAQAAIREAQMEAAIQQLSAQVKELEDNPLVEVKEDARSAESE